MRFAQSSSSLDDVGEGLVRTQLHQDVHVVFVLEAPLELDDVRVVDAAVDADLGEDLLARAVLLQRALRHNLRREGLARARILHRVHHREPALAERSAAHVRARAGLARARVLVRLRHDAGALHLLGAVPGVATQGGGREGGRGGQRRGSARSRRTTRKTGGVRRSAETRPRGDARGSSRRPRASADVLLLLLGFGRGLWGFRRGRDVLLVVRHRGARRGLHRARTRFERGSPPVDATHFLGCAARRRPARRRASRGNPSRRDRMGCRLDARR